MKLALLIPTIKGREDYLNRLLSILKPQCKGYENKNIVCELDYEYEISEYKEVILIILKDDRKMTIGAKRNLLMQLAIKSGASHRAFIDDDDTVSDDYIELNMPGVRGNFDCNSLVGVYSVNGNVNPNKHIFLHSLKYTHWYEDEKHYYRNPNHLNVVKIDLIKDIKFQEKNFGEDGCWSEDLAKAGVLKNEYEITKPFYNYLFRSKPDGI